MGGGSLGGHRVAVKGTPHMLIPLVNLMTVEVNLLPLAMCNSRVHLQVACSKVLPLVTCNKLRPMGTCSKPLPLVTCNNHHRAPIHLTGVGLEEDPLPPNSGKTPQVRGVMNTAEILETGGESHTQSGMTDEAVMTGMLPLPNDPVSRRRRDDTSAE